MRMATIRSTNKRRLSATSLVILASALLLAVVSADQPPVNTPQLNHDSPVLAAVAAPEVASSSPTATQTDSAASKLTERAEVKAEPASDPAKRDAHAPVAASVQESEAESSNRKGRAEPAAAEKTEPPKDKEASDKEHATKSAPSEPQKQATKSQEQKGASQPKAATKQTPPATKGPAKKLPANLGTVTNTGSGGQLHYMSKHDAYSAIAEKHGALTQESASRKSDKRSQLHHFSGIQKASGLGDMLNPFRQVTDSGLARTLGASMRSIMKGKYSVPAYVASALLGAVALLAFYESPMSPLPVPPLPEPPVGRFPPEHPSLPVGSQVPFRVNQLQQQYGGQQQNYNQRSFVGQQSAVSSGSQQVLFPGQAAQQRQSVAGSGPAAGPVQQLAANLLSSVGRPQIAQRKSGLDFEQPAAPRGLFGASGQLVAASRAATGSSSPPKPSGGFLSFLGFGGSQVSTAPTSGELLAQASNPLVALGLAPANPSDPNKLNSGNQGLSNSHLINKVKSYFSRSPSQASAVSPTGSQSSAMAASGAAASTSGTGSSNSATAGNPYDQYSRMSLVQALIKDTSFLPQFLNPNRKQSTVVQSPGAAAAAAAAASSSAKAQAQGAANGPSARMQVDTPAGPLQKAKQVATSSAGHSIAKTADRIAHTLLETLSSGIMQRSAPSSSASNLATGSASSDQSERRALDGQASMASSFLSDIVSSYNSALGSEQIHQHQQQSQQPTAATASSGGQDQTMGRSASQDSQEEEPKVNSQAQTSSSPQAASSQVHPAHGARKTRSIGLDYPTSDGQQPSQQQQQQYQPSRAAKINDLVDYVADSYASNRMLINFVMNQVGLSHAVPYVEQVLSTGDSPQKN